MTNTFANNCVVDGDITANENLYVGKNSSVGETISCKQMEVTEPSTNGTGDYRYIVRLLKPNITSGNRVEILVGQDESNNKSCKFGWYKANTDADSYGSINVYGTEDIITFNSSDVKIRGNSINSLIADINNLKALL